MYQTLVSSATRVSRIAGPVCITRLAMRPAKSFWKNAQDWRTTYQWFCHLMRLETLAEIAWFAIRFCAVSAIGRATSSTNAIAKRCGQNFANSSSGGLAVISVTMRPMNTGMVESSNATTKPAANNAANRPFAWRAKCQKNATKPGGGSVRSGVSVGFNRRSKNENMAQARNGSSPRPAPFVASRRGTTLVHLSDRGEGVEEYRGGSVTACNISATGRCNSGADGRTDQPNLRKISAV